jgi:uncharacterized protein with HEPN domain
MQPNDKAYLWDIEEACKDIIDFMKETSYSKFENDKMKRFAVERQLLVIGEAANHLSDECRKDNSEVPWKLIIGLRNIIAHDYGEILIDRIFKITQENMQELKDQV